MTDQVFAEQVALPSSYRSAVDLARFYDQLGERLRQSLAARVMPSGSAGKRLVINDNNEGPRPVEIVGVIGDVRHTALDQPGGLDIYLPLRQIHRDRVSALVTNQFWMVKTGSDPAAFGRTFVGHLQAIDPDAAVSGPGAMRRTLDTWFGPRRFTLGVFSAFALTAVALAVFGLYGLVAFVVAQRSREIGLRMAIGASRGEVVRMVLEHAGRLIAFGISVGVIAAAILRPYVATWFSGIEVNAITVTTAIMLLVLTVLGAATLPARRAAHIDPALALRGE